MLFIEKDNPNYVQGKRTDTKSRLYRSSPDRRK